MTSDDANYRWTYKAAKYYPYIVIIALKGMLTYFQPALYCYSVGNICKWTMFTCSLNYMYRDITISFSVSPTIILGGHPPPPLKLKFILFNFIFSEAPDHNRSNLKLPFL